MPRVAERALYLELSPLQYLQQMYRRHLDKPLLTPCAVMPLKILYLQPAHTLSADLPPMTAEETSAASHTSDRTAMAVMEAAAMASGSNFAACRPSRTVCQRKGSPFNEVASFWVGWFYAASFGLDCMLKP